MLRRGQHANGQEMRTEDAPHVGGAAQERGEGGKAYMSR